MHTTLTSPGKTVTIGHDQPFVIIGERINLALMRATSGATSLGLAAAAPVIPLIDT